MKWQSNWINSNDKNISFDTQFCYPHGTDCLSIMVPVVNQHASALYSLAHPLIYAVGILFIIMAILRTISGVETFPHAVFITIAALFAQNFRRKPVTVSAKVWDSTMLLFTLSSSIFLSSTLYTNLINDGIALEIDTLQQLADSNLRIVVVDNSSQDTWTFER